MRAIIETVFDIFYLVTVLTLGIRMIRSSKAGTQFRLFGLMAVVLGAGDSFHLVPRALALCTTCLLYTSGRLLLPHQGAVPAAHRSG